MSETVFLRFASEAEAQAVLISFGAGPSEGEGFRSYGTGLYAGHRYDYAVVNLVGLISRPTGATIETPNGPEPEMAPVPGYHVNILWRGPAELIPDFGAARVHPVTPECVFTA